MPIDPRILAALDRPMTGPTGLRFAAKRGYVAPPRTGPVGETCGTCRAAQPTGCDKRESFCSAIPETRADRGVTIYLGEKACGRWERKAQ